MNKIELIKALLDDTSIPTSKATPGIEGVSCLEKRAYIIRTVTHTYTGMLVGETNEYLTLDTAAWIADSGRWADAVSKGTLDEVEPMGNGVYVAKGAIIDITPWNHELPSTQK